jgi:PIN like domain
LRLTTLAEQYGIPNDENVLDVTWIRDSAGAGRVALMKDEEIARNPAERATVQAEGARCFCLARKDLPAAEMAGWFLSALPDMVHACGSVPAPFIFTVERARVRQIL